MIGERQEYATCATCGGRLRLLPGGAVVLAPEAGPPYAAPAPEHACTPWVPAHARTQAARKAADSARTRDPWRDAAYKDMPRGEAALAWLRTFAP